MRAPGFWWKDEPTAEAYFLSPAATIYGWLAGRRMAQRGARSDLPVICVGNFVAGGAGKTPTAQALAKLLSRMGETPAFLSRGYGGRLRGPVAVDASRHTAAEVGDEPLLLARQAPTVVARRRPTGAELAKGLGASVIIMDDGLQNPSLEKDLAVAVVDGAAGFGNALCIPAGPLRAPLAQQLPHVQAIIVVGPGKAKAALTRLAPDLKAPIIEARLVAAAEASALLQGKRVLAFAGIGHPEKLFSTLAEVGAEVVDRMAFPDHRVFGSEDVAEILRRARARGLMVVTTEKDAVRLAGQSHASELLSQLCVLQVGLCFENEAAVRELVTSALARRRGTR